MTKLRPRGVSVPRSGSDAGLSLIEVIVAITLFAIIGAGVAAMMTTGIATSRNAKDRSVASQVAGERLEAARSTALASFATLNVPSVTITTATVNGQTFTVKQTASFSPKSTPAGSCNATSQGGNVAVTPVVLLTAAVSWPTMGKTKPVTTATTFKPPVGAYAAGTGGIDIKVLGAANQPMANIPLTVSGPSPTTTVVSDASGCAFAAFLTPGTYTVTASAAGHVDGQELPVSVQSAGVLTGSVTSVSFFYDQAAELDATFIPAGLTPASNLPITVGNSGLAPLKTFTLARGVTALKPLFPYSSYGVWAGRCPEADPGAVNNVNTPLYPGAVATNATPIAGGAAPVKIPLYPVHLTVTLGGVPVDGATITATETAGGAKFACSALATYGLVSSSTVSSVAGQSVTGLPLGHFLVKATYGAATSTTPVSVGPSGFTGSVAL